MGIGGIVKCDCFYLVLGVLGVFGLEFCDYCLKKLSKMLFFIGLEMLERMLVPQMTELQFKQQVSQGLLAFRLRHDTLLHCLSFVSLLLFFLTHNLLLLLLLLD